MKQIIFAIFLVGITFNLSAQDDCKPLFPKIELNSLDSLIEGNWFYEYSFNSDSTFDVFSLQHLDYNIPEKIDFYLSSKKENKYTSSNSVIHEHRSSSCLEKLECFQDYKGIACYPRLRSDSTDSKGYLINCQIDLMMKTEIKVAHSKDDLQINIYSLSPNILIIEKSSSLKNRVGFHVFVKK